MTDSNIDIRNFMTLPSYLSQVQGCALHLSIKGRPNLYGTCKIHVRYTVKIYFKEGQSCQVSVVSGVTFQNLGTLKHNQKSRIYY